MSKETFSSFRNNDSKCLFNDVGFCKFRESCRKQHFSEKCEVINCDRKCSKRHPKECKHGEKCKFNAKNVCAFDHDGSENKTTKAMDDAKDILEQKLLNTEKKFANEIKDLTNKCEEQSRKISNLESENHDASNKSIDEAEKLFEQKLKVVENVLFKEIESSKNKCVKQEKEILELKRANEMKCKESEIKMKEVNHFKGIVETVLKEVEILKKENIKQTSEMKLIREELNELVKNQTQVKANEKVETNDEPKQPKIDDTKIKSKKIKITKDVIEERLTAAYKNDIKVMLDDFTNAGLDTLSQRCDKCDHRTHSEGLLREHQRNKHNIKESQQNIIMGFEFKGISASWSSILCCSDS